MTTKILRAVVATTLLAIPLATRANLISNGGFEVFDILAPPITAPNHYQYRTGGEITDWLITPAVVQFEVPYQPVGVPNYSVQLETGLPNGSGSIEQTFSTVAGTTYYVSFLLASWQGNLSALLVSIDGTLNPFAASSTSYTLEGFSFLADDSSATLKFANTGPHGVSFPQLDAVSVIAVPEPTTMIAGALLLLPFGAATLRILRKRVA